MKAYDAPTGSVWECVGKFEIIFFPFDGHVDMVVIRSVLTKKGKNLSRSISMPFRNYLDLSTGKVGQFSQDSLMNKIAKRVK